MALFGTLETLRVQSLRTPQFDVAWRYIVELTRASSPIGQRVASLAIGDSVKHELDGGVFAIEQVYVTKPRPEGFFESHRRYIDIQVIVAGQEIMEVVDLAHATVRETYREERDLIVYHDAPMASRLKIAAGAGAIFYPVDVHMPSLRVGNDGDVVRKSVLKIPFSA